MNQFNREGTITSSFGTNGRINHDSSKFYDSKLYKELNNGKEVTKTVNEFPEELLLDVQVFCIHQQPAYGNTLILFMLNLFNAFS